MTELTVLKYETLDMYSISSSHSRHKIEDSLKCVSNGVLTDFVLFILQ